MTRRSFPMLFPLLPLALHAIACAPTLAQDGVPRILISTDMQEQDVSLVRVESDRVLYRDALGMLRSEPTSRLLAITSGDDEARPLLPDDDKDADSAVLQLTDGQRLTGRLVPLAAGADPDETIRWSHPILGALEFPLDVVDRLILVQGRAARAPAGTGDVVILANGDRLEGFIVGIGGAVHLEIGEEVRQLPLDRIGAIVMANPAESLAGSVVYLRDGSILASTDLAAAPDGHISIIPSSGNDLPRNAGSESAAIPIPLVEVSAVLFDAMALISLAGLPVERQEPAGGRRWVPPLRILGPDVPLLGAPDLELPGPTTVDWRLPEGAAMFATTAHLPRTMWNWGDCELVVSLIGTGPAGPARAASPATPRESEVFRARMNADAPTARIVLDLAAAARLHRGQGLGLRIRVEPGLHGPIQDQIVLRRPMLRIDLPPG